MTRVLYAYTCAVLKMLAQEERRVSELYGSTSQRRDLLQMEEDGYIVYDGEYYRLTGRGQALYKAVSRVVEIAGTDEAVDGAIALLQGRNIKRKRQMAIRRRIIRTAGFGAPSEEENDGNTNQ